MIEKLGAIYVLAGILLYAGGRRIGDRWTRNVLTRR